MNSWGNTLRLSIFGESHGNAIGMVIDGIPAGELIDLDMIAAEMKRRAPGNDAFSTPRKEADAVEILSGLTDGHTTGFPICGVIHNSNTRSRDYNSMLRPGHADMTALLKYNGHADMRGGGHFSGRLTAPLVFAGAIAKQVLARRYDLRVHARITQIGSVYDHLLLSTPQQYRSLLDKPLPVADDAAMDAMREAILQAKGNHDSIGGVIECTAFGAVPGWGEPFFGSVESTIASLLYSIPAVKGVEFGDGFALAGMHGSQANDPIAISESGLCTTTNHNGGILGGITNGMPVRVRAAIKPTPSIAQEQQTVDAATMQPATLQIQGRHDPCIVQRAVPVVEAAIALALLDLSLQSLSNRGER